MISKSLARDVLNTALSTGGDFAEIYFEDTISSNISIENTKVDAAQTSTSSGVGLRILNKLQSVYGHTNDLSRKSLLKLASDLSASFSEKQKIHIENFKVKHAKLKDKIAIPYDTVPKEEIIKVLRSASEIVSSFDKHIVKSEATLVHSEKKIVIFNSEGKEIINHNTYARIYIIAVGADNGKIQTSFAGPGTKKGWEFFTKEINIEKIAKDTASNCIKFLYAKEAPSGKMPVVLAHGWGGVLFHESCGHPLEAAAVSKGLSCFTKEMVGTKIASDVVSAYDDGSLPNEWGSINVDDEGHKPHKICLIKNGVLSGFMVDNFCGRRMDYHETGSSRRQNYTFEPISRMTNTYIDNGKSTLDEIIKATKLGLYAVDFSGGSVNPATGEFNFTTSQAYIIRDGKICEPVRDATLIGKGNEILHNIDMVANDRSFGQGNCGASSGYIPVNVGQPTLRIQDILVGGRGGELK